MSKPSIGILSLGCPRNLVDSEAMMGRLKKKGYRINDVAASDIAIINTCAFIKDAKKESIDTILDLIELKKEGRIKKIVACGCLVERYGKVLKKELPEVDAFIGAMSLNHSKERFPITPLHYAYLKICESCTNFCSFCIIPKIKGKFRSESADSLLEKVKQFDRNRVSELNIIGQDITSYGVDLSGKKMLPPFLKKILKTSKHIKWFRLLYFYPDLEVIDGFLDIMKDDPRVCRYIDLPLQHINDRVLKLMNRHITKVEILKIIERIRKKAPDAAIRTTLIVGFPGETDKDFSELSAFVKETKFERLGVFSYSREEGTPAYSFKQQVPEAVKSERLDKIMLMQQEISKDNNKKMLNKEISVIMEGKEENSYIGRSQFDAPEVDGQVFLRSARVLKPGDIVKAKVTGFMEYDLIGELV
ncbi:MAG: MiaB/RimO family radical SAM methylthiotransferase [Candidatus Omnitrophica bacterium]|nr:MiaB/RimO family radical SAM methylthiotransferase [Candidatus Omnitrophota bacterium]